MKRKVVFISSIVLISFFSLFLLYKYSLFIVVREYEGEPLNGDFLRNGDSDYEIGVNLKGFVIFKSPHKALEAAISDYEAGFLAIQKEFNLDKVNDDNYQWYKVYGTQLSKNNSDIAVYQALQISYFFDIYENSGER